jgi:hypothetical protein
VNQKVEKKQEKEQQTQIKRNIINRLERKRTATARDK